MQNAREQDIQKSIIDYLRLKKFVVFKHHSTGFTVRNGAVAAFKYSEKGISDIIALSPKGAFVAIEVKRKGGKISDDQWEFIRSVIANGGIGIIAYSLDDVVGKVDDKN